MARGKRTHPLKVRAVRILAAHGMKPAEIAQVLSTPRRTIYLLIERATEKEAQWQAEREREEAERKEREINQNSLQPEWREEEKEPVSYLQNIRRFRS